MATTFRVRSSALPSDTHVLALRGSEGMSRPYAFDIYLHIVGDQEVDLDDAVGAKISLNIDASQRRPDGSALMADYHGIIAAIDHVRAVVGSALYRVRLVPNLWDLSHTRHSRIFTKLSIPDVIKAVLQDEGITQFEFRLANSYEPEEHVCQYRESSLDFIHRWMEREGMYYYFEQSDSEETLIITDDLARHQVSAVPPVMYHPSEDDKSAGTHFNQFSARHSALPASVKLVDYDYTKPQLEVSGSSSVSHIGVGEMAIYGNRFFNSAQGTHLAKVRAEDLRVQGKNYHASGGVLGLASGFKFFVENHTKASFNSEYLAVSIEHFGYVSDLAKGWGRAIPHEYEEPYRIELVAIEASQQYRHPEITAWPRIDGYENAVVDGPATSDYAQLDNHGRYAIKFKFDEGTLKDGKASTFVRKMQPHAGTVEGWHFPERKGAEVVCAFMAGDPDRPIIVGAIPNAVTPSPVTAANNTKNVIQTGGLNRLEIEDQAGLQRVHLTTPHAQTGLLMGNPLEGHEMLLTTQGNSHHHTTADHLTTVDGNHVENVGATLSQTVQAAVTHLFNATLDQTVQAAVTHTFNATLEQKVAAAVTQTFNTTLNQTVQAAVTHVFNATLDQTVAAAVTHQFNATQTTTVADDVIEHYLATHKKEVADCCEVSIGDGWSSLVGGDWLTKVGGTKQEIVAGVEICLKGGASIEAIAGIDVSVVGGIMFDAHVGPAYKMGSEEIKLHVVHSRLCVDRTEAEAADNKLAAMKQTLSGLLDATAGLSQMAAGVTDTETGLHNVSAGLFSAEAGLTMIE